MAKKKIIKPAKRSKSEQPKDTLISTLILEHFGQVKPEDLNISERQFPFTESISILQNEGEKWGNGAEAEDDISILGMECT